MKYPSKIVMSNDEYHKHEAVGSSGLRTIIQKSPAHFLWKLKNPSSTTPAKELGTMIHTAILETDKFSEKAIVMPEFSGTGSRAEKDKWLTENHGKIILKIDQLEMINGILAAIAKHKTASAYLSEGAAEESLFCIDAETKIPIKARPDFTREGHIIVDVKSTNDADWFSFQKAIVTYDYDVQAALYLDIATEVYGKKFDEFVIIAIEKEPPYGLNCFLLTDETVAEGRSKYQQALQILKKCRETGIYPSYPDETKSMWLPSWAIKGDNQND